MNDELTRSRRRVLIVDDHALVRAGFKRILDATDDLEAAGEAGTAAEAHTLIAAGRYDVVMLDISLPDANVLETVAALRRRHPELIVVDPKVVQCDARKCQTVIDGIPIYSDLHHLTDFGAETLAARLLRRSGNPLSVRSP